MNKNQDILAKKYATAFLNCYEKTVSLHDFCSLVNGVEALKQYHRMFTLLDISYISKTSREKALDAILKKTKIPRVIDPLLQLLTDHQRLSLFPLVIWYVTVVYGQRHALLLVTLRSSLALTQEYTDILKGFLSKQTGCHIIATPLVDSALIAGIRMESSTYLWEHSIAQRLRFLRQLILT
jgi:F0F1-type ATP synthase delta subunit